MKYMQVELQLLSPTCIAQRPTSPGQLTGTLGYLSGTALRGRLAGRWLAGRRYDQLDEQLRRHFQALFLNGAVVFGNAWPLYRDSRGEWRTAIVPQTAWTHKRSGGWQGDMESGVRDVLAVLLAATALDDSDPERRDAARRAEELLLEGERLEDLDRVEDEYAVERGGRWRGLTPARRLITRTALTQNEPELMPMARGIVAAGQLYSFEALETGQRFSAVISGPNEQVDELAQLLEMAKRDSLALGQGRSRGLGQVRVRHVAPFMVETRDTASLDERARRFSDRATAPVGLLYLPVTLEADMILRDRYLLPCSSGAPRETLSRYLEGAPAGMELHIAVQRTRWLSGWDEIRRVPRQPQFAVQQGSVWVYSVAREDLAAAIGWWLDAERQGLGERRGEGFGRVRLLHPFHAEERKVW